MSLAVEKLDGSMAKLTITVPAEEITKAITSAYNKQKSKFSVPGFRKGKVPQAFIEKMYGAAIFYEDAANQLINEYYPKELENCEEEITSNPEIDVTQIEKGKDFIFTATVAVKPEIKIGDYKGVEIEKIDTTVTDEDVMAEILKDQKENGRKIDVTDRAAQMDDEVTINFEGFVDDVAFEGGKGENYKLTLGSHSFIDTFEDQIVGKNIGDKFDVNVTFPEEYQAAELAGKDAKAIFSAFHQGNLQATTIIKRSANTIANLITNIKATTDADCVVLGGSVGLANGYLELVQVAMAQQPLALQVPIVSAHYHHDAGLWGAALWSREQ